MKTELVTTLKRQATRLISELQEARSPILITEHGKPAAYLVDIESYDRQQDRVRILEGIARGERAVQEGNILTQDQARKEDEEMARLIWTEPALKDLETIAEYIALDKPDAARKYVQTVFTAVERLSQFPKSGSIPHEISDLPYRQVVVPPCRVFYRFNKDYVFIVFVMRSEQDLRPEILIERDEDQSSQRMDHTR